MAELYMHIGLPKTGTSSIQHACFKNRRALEASYGIRYAGFAKNHSNALALLFDETAATKPSLIAKGVTNESKLEAARVEAKNQLGEFLRSDAGATLLLSGENGSNLNRSNVESLAEFLSVHGVKLAKVICYVREPASFATSIAQQRLKANATFEKLLKSPPLPKFRKKINPWLKVFGRETLEIRVFEDAIKSEHGLVGDFLETIGVDPAGIGAGVGTVLRNTSLSMEAAQIVEAVNQVRPLVSGRELTSGRARQDVNQIFGGIPGGRFSLGSSFEKAARENSRADIAWLESVLGRTNIFPERATTEPEAHWSNETLQQLGLRIFDLYAENQSLKHAIRSEDSH